MNSFICARAPHVVHALGKMRFKKKRFVKSSGILLIEYAKRGQLKKIMDLLQPGHVNVNSVEPKYHSSALFWASYHGHSKIVTELLKHGADPNLATVYMQTAVHAACMNGSVATLCALLEYGGDLRAHTLSYETPRDIAVRKRHMDLVSVIEDVFSLTTTLSGNDIAHGQHMLRPKNSFIPACPRWMHNVSSNCSIERTSPSPSNLVCPSCEGLTVFDYGQAYAFGCKGQPGACGMVPEIISAELSKPFSGEQNLLGSVYQQCRWQDCDVTIKRSVHYSNNNNNNKKIDYYINFAYTNKHLFKEVDLLSKLRHPNIVLIMAVCCGPTINDILMVLEPIALGSLFTLLHHSDKELTNHEKVAVLCDALDGLHYLHRLQGITHCSVSSYSILLSTRGAKLGNFQLAIQQGCGGMIYNDNKQLFPWMAPEVLAGRIPTMESDCYSIAVVMWEIFVETIPWDGMSAVEVFTTVVMNRERLNTDMISWSIIRRLIINLFTTQPIHRPASDKIKKIIQRTPIQ